MVRPARRFGRKVCQSVRASRSTWIDTVAARARELVLIVHLFSGRNSRYHCTITSTGAGELSIISAASLPDDTETTLDWGYASTLRRARAACARDSAGLGPRRSQAATATANSTSNAWVRDMGGESYLWRSGRVKL